MGYPRPTINGYHFGLASSMLQKFIRRGMEREALFMAAELERSGYGKYVWKRLRVICSEDVGLAWIEGPAVIRALNENYLQFIKENDNPNRPGHRLYLVHAVLLLVRAPKSRLVDHATLAIFRTTDRVEIPDFAYDKHTSRGKRLGRGIEHFFEEGAALGNEDPSIEDVYRQEAIDLLLAEERGDAPPASAHEPGQASLGLGEDDELG